MKISVFTPTHNAAHLARAWESLRSQDHEDWEWVVLVNNYGKAERERIESAVNRIVGDDSRARIFVHHDYELNAYGSNSPNIGLLKRIACSHCTGDVFLELDHDDELTRNCLSEVAKAIGERKLAFVYSDDLTLDANDNSVAYAVEYGWRHYNVGFGGAVRQVNQTFPINPRSLCEILYAPDHVRAWTREAYRVAGGHNDRLAVADDHELMIRTYLNGIEFVRAGGRDEPLYVHYLRGDNTSQRRVDEIQTISLANRDAYLRPLIFEWCRRESLPMFDLGGAHNCPPGFIPIDENLPMTTEAGDGKTVSVNPYSGDVFVVVSRMKDNSVGCFRASDFLEHIPSTKIPALMNMLYDKLVPGGWIISDTPAVCDNQGRCGRGAYQDPTHVSFWSSNSFWYYSKREFAKYVPEIRCRFQTVRISNQYPSEFHKNHLIPYVTWDACALKWENGHWPGPTEI